MSSNTHIDNNDDGRHRTASSLDSMTLLQISDDAIKETVAEDLDAIPKAKLLVMTDTDKLHDGSPEDGLLVDFEHDLDFENSVDHGSLKVGEWGCKKFYSDYIKEGLAYKAKKEGKEPHKDVVMLFESPSTSTTESSFHNPTKYRFHDWPPPKSTLSKAVLGPCRYGSMNGSAYPVFLRAGAATPGLMEHWAETIPNYCPPTWASKIEIEKDLVYSYLPVEAFEAENAAGQVNAPAIHYHLAGKDAIHMMTTKTTKLLPDTHTIRPCVVKTTHSMGSKGIFIIHNDEDEKEFEQFLRDSGNPTFVIVDFVDIARNVACHFFMHPDGRVVWFGSNENHRDADGRFSSDSYLLLEHQEKLKEMQLPFVEEVVRYCQALGFWGFCGIDVLFDSKGLGYLVDINPRVTGSCPALMTLKLLSKKYNYQVGLFRRSGDINYYGSAAQLFEEVREHNKANEGKNTVVVHSLFEAEPNARCRVNLGVYGNSLEECKNILNRFAQPAKKAK
ncbi:hypothetical protein FisN_2Lh178 [Fistulifera solaris]|uniref:ATP-grasp domain-containing protein n=1 Tax=Fistulifera solaris TaxID=1519565 RepID=A0A1Z5KFB1_FISSO|nr:hypothetical protein FisN_2Lh178 [Fistulifera solaris]|eukprot:GAX24907.1 hypothetical protein FisN_2Lh178 [Fistulifera solaris]